MGRQGQFRTIKICIMVCRRIVFVGSSVGKLTRAGFGVYCATKYAIESIGDAFRMVHAVVDFI